ncbi:MAG: hypothetical protein J6Y37_15235 [Paludibacteraceae bacterium]|nr:hypothetical protein [Paludibacteraceae bacterium]
MEKDLSYGDLAEIENVFNTRCREMGVEWVDEDVRSECLMDFTEGYVEDEGYMPLLNGYGYNRCFHAVIQLDKLRIFEVSYYYCGDNDEPYFSTCAGEFCRNKRDFVHCGQCQKDVCAGSAAATWFYEKWDKHHIHKLSGDDWLEMMLDLKDLCGHYNHIFRWGNRSLSFVDEVELSKMPPKHTYKTLTGWNDMVRKRRAVFGKRVLVCECDDLLKKC